MAVPGPPFLAHTRALVIGVLGLVVLFLGGIILGIVISDGSIPAVWVSVVLTGAAVVVMALGAFFMWFGLSRAYPA